MGQTELEASHRNCMSLARRMANGRMQNEILPILQKAGFNIPARSWNPLQFSSQDVGDLSQILKPATAPEIVYILSHAALHDQVFQIVHDSLQSAFIRDTELHGRPFIAAILRDLIRDDSVLRKLGVLDDRPSS